MRKRRKIYAYFRVIRFKIKKKWNRIIAPKNVMVIGITYLDNGYVEISYVLKTQLELKEYRGLVPLKIKLKGHKFADFIDFGKWKKGEFGYDGFLVDIY